MRHSGAARSARLYRARLDSAEKRRRARAVTHAPLGRDHRYGPLCGCDLSAGYYQRLVVPAGAAFTCPNCARITANFATYRARTEADNA